MSVLDQLQQKILNEARALSPWVQEMREDFHRHPELRFEEHRTSEVCATELENVGISVERAVGLTGVVGTPPRLTPTIWPSDLRPSESPKPCVCPTVHPTLCPTVRPSDRSTSDRPDV